VNTYASHTGDGTTWFAPAGRASIERLRQQQDIVRNASLLRPMMDAMPTNVAVLNRHRQVVAANRALLALLGTDAEAVVGKRPGEAVGCIHCAEGPDGCGTGKHCFTCGAVAAIMESQAGTGRATRECRITSASSAMDLRVTASALDVDGETLTVCAIEDISGRKRLDVLMRTFFHDVLNTAGGIRGYADFLAEELAGDLGKHENLCELAALAHQIVEEIESQRDLVYAEAGELEARMAPVRTADLLNRLRALYERHEAAAGRKIALVADWEGTITTDARLLGRVLGNMLKNALEATPPGRTVTVRCLDQGPRVVFAVENVGVMPEEIQLQVFQRSFSTKAATGRGIGTHSIKLLGEKYLGGQVGFVSREPEGTRFTLTVPKTPT
jgi:K+-sensing histidine kinase KdpD